MPAPANVGGSNGTITVETSAQGAEFVTVSYPAIAAVPAVPASPGPPPVPASPAVPGQDAHEETYEITSEWVRTAFDRCRPPRDKVSVTVDVLGKPMVISTHA